MPERVLQHLPESAQELLKIRAERHGRTLAAEVRDILEDASLIGDSFELGAALSRLAHIAGMPAEDAPPLPRFRDLNPLQ